MSNYNPKPLEVRVIYISVDYGPGGGSASVQNLEVVKMPGTSLFISMFRTSRMY